MSEWWMLIQNSVIVFSSKDRNRYRFNNRPAGGFYVFIFQGLLYEHPINQQPTEHRGDLP
jgi:hypothetical protein